MNEKKSTLISISSPSPFDISQSHGQNLVFESEEELTCFGEKNSFAVKRVRESLQDLRLKIGFELKAPICQKYENLDDLLIHSCPSQVYSPI